MKSLCRFAANRFSGTLTPLSRQTICHFHISLFFKFIWSTSYYLFKFSQSIAVLNLFIPNHFFSTQIPRFFIHYPVAPSPRPTPAKYRIFLIQFNFSRTGYPVSRGILYKDHTNHKHFLSRFPIDQPQACPLFSTKQIDITSPVSSGVLSKAHNFFLSPFFHTPSHLESQPTPRLSTKPFSFILHS